MSQKNKKQFGIWMDSHHATIVGREQVETGNFVVLAHVENEGPGNNPHQKAANNIEKAMQQKYFKEIMAKMQNAEEVHVTGTGQEQEQFIHHLAATPQFKNTVAKESTSNKMSDEKLVSYIAEKFSTPGMPH